MPVTTIERETPSLVPATAEPVFRITECEEEEPRLVSLLELMQANRQDPGAIEPCFRAERGDVFYLGGGAFAVWIVERVR